MAKVWHAKEAVVKIDEAADVTITTAAALDTFFASATAIEGKLKDVTITEPIGDVDQLDFHGTDSSGYQNAEGEEKPAVMGECTGTLLLEQDSVLYTMLYGAGEDIPPATPTHTRYLPGKAAMPKVSILVNLDDGTDELNFVLANAWVTKREDSSTGADGHFEVSVAFKCLPRDFAGPELSN